jgi:hypothetical protein
MTYMKKSEQLLASRLLTQREQGISIRRQWPFTEKVTDWAKVKALAEENQSAGPKSADRHP